MPKSEVRTICEGDASPAAIKGWYEALEGSKQRSPMAVTEKEIRKKNNQI